MDVLIFYLTQASAAPRPSAASVASAIVDMPIADVLPPSLQIREAAALALRDGVTLDLGPVTHRDRTTGVTSRHTILRWIAPSAIVGVQILAPSREDWTAPEGREARVYAAEERARLAKIVLDNVILRLGS